MKLNKEEIQAIDLSELAEHITNPEAKGFFLGDAGREHYKLLAWLSMQFDNPLIADIGTFRGCSALALSYNTSGFVNSYDIGDSRTLKRSYPINIDFTMDGVESDMQISGPILSSDLIFLDTVHDGIHERKVIDWLIKNEWKGIMILDDIHHFPEQNKLWNDITLRKQDITDIGHWSGTGIIYFE